MNSDTTCSCSLSFILSPHQLWLTIIQVSGHNWLLNVKLKTSQVVNPIMHQYEGRQDFIEFHSGFGLYMLRPRKDTGLNKIQEIALKVDAIGQELAPDGNYELSITGHSLGGALATVLGETLFMRHPLVLLA